MRTEKKYILHHVYCRTEVMHYNTSPSIIVFGWLITFVTFQFDNFARYSSGTHTDPESSLTRRRRRPFWSEGGLGCHHVRKKSPKESETIPGALTRRDREGREREETSIPIHARSYRRVARLQNALNYSTAEGERSIQENIGKYLAAAS
jgi:hypothetical protein